MRMSIMDHPFPLLDHRPLLDQHPLLDHPLLDHRATFTSLEYEDARLRLRERLSGLNLRPKTEPEPNRTINEP